MDHAQLLKLVDEAHAVLTPQQIHTMAASMDLEDGEVVALLMEATAEWDGLKNMHNPPTATSAREYLFALMRKHDNHGACDSEGMYAVERVERAAGEGKPFPLIVREWPHDNPFELYQSRPGWQTASAELIQAAERYWRALVEEKLGITIA